VAHSERNIYILLKENVYPRRYADVIGSHQSKKCGMRMPSGNWYGNSKEKIKLHINNRTKKITGILTAFSSDDIV